MYELKDKYGTIQKVKTLKKAREIAYERAQSMHIEVSIYKDAKLIEVARW